MTVNVLNNKSFMLPDFYKEISNEKDPGTLLKKQIEHSDDYSSSDDEDSNLGYVESCSIIDENILPTPTKERKRKRSRNSSSSGNSSYSSSPEIKYNSPVKYQLSTRNSTTIVIKKTMSRRSQIRSKKCTDTDITQLLESNDDDDDDDREEIFDVEKKSLAGKKKIEPKNSVKIKISRLTGQNDYKVESVNAHKRSPSSKSTTSSPRKCKSNERKSPPRTPSRRVAESRINQEKKDLKNYEKEEDKRTQRNQNIENESLTPSKSSVLKSITTTPGGKKRVRNTRLSNFNDDRLEDRVLNEMNKENESEDDQNSDDSDIYATEENTMKSDDKQLGTPRKKNNPSEIMDTTPKTRTKRLSSRLAEKNETTLQNTPEKLSQLIEEPVTPKRRTTVSKNQTPSVKVHSLTPSMCARKSNVGKPKTLFEIARAQLHVSAVPKSLPCREQEFNDVFTFLERKLVDRTGGCMYISGVPGTGKTATVNEAIRCLRKLVTKDVIEDFKFIEINGMKLAEPRQAYVQILKQLTGESATWEVARKVVEKKLTNPKSKTPMTLLLIDELDVLCNKRQDVVYNLLDWPSQPSVKLVVITIANTMDLPERVLMSRVTSRLGLTRLTFQPYNHKQLQEIVTVRLNESDAFKGDAVQLVARKVAAVSGDARRALDICRRATEIAELDESKIVFMKHVTEALTEMIASPKVRAIVHCSKMEKIFLQAICAEIKRTGVEETIFNNVYKQFEALCSFEGEKTPNITESLSIAVRLSANRLILCDESTNDIQQKIFLNVSSDDIHYALQNVTI